MLVADDGEDRTGGEPEHVLNRLYGASTVLDNGASEDG
jgi:hypothetical protein